MGLLYCPQRQASGEYMVEYDAFATLDTKNCKWHCRLYRLCARANLCLDEMRVDTQHIIPTAFPEQQIWPIVRGPGLGRRGRGRGGARGRGRGRVGARGAGAAHAAGRGGDDAASDGESGGADAGEGESDASSIESKGGEHRRGRR